MIKLLIVEDDEITRSLFQFVFAGSNWSLALADGVAAALQAYLADTPDLIITDIFLSDAHGTCLATAIRELEQAEKRRRIPIIGISAGVQEDNRDRCLDSGMDAFLTKPFKLDAMKATIDDLLATAACR